MKLQAALLVAGFLIAPAALSSPGADRYYVIVWGAQRPVFKSPRYAHSFATFVHIDCAGRTEEITISWLPATGYVRPLARRPEPGRNFSLCETLDYCGQNRMEVAAWGPYITTEDLWQRALCYKARLDSGVIGYRADDDFDDDSISNCVHAVGGVVRAPGERRYIYVSPANWGESGSYWLALLLRPWYVDPCCTQPWVMCRLGLDPKSFIHYDLSRNPAAGPVFRATQALIHHELLPNRVRCD
jgi:hypothetical protein